VNRSFQIRPVSTLAGAPRPPILKKPLIRPKPVTKLMPAAGMASISSSATPKKTFGTAVKRVSGFLAKEGWTLLKTVRAE